MDILSAGDGGEDGAKVPEARGVGTVGGGPGSAIPMQTRSLSRAQMAAEGVAPTSFEKTLQSRTLRLQDRYQIYHISENVLEWALKAFSLYSPDGSTEIDAWEMKQALLSCGKDITDGVLYDMLRMQGKVESQDMTINFKEFSQMCWKQFFEPLALDDQVADVQDAFIILGGGTDGSGQVSVEKLKAFTESTELTIDVDKFVAEVDDDDSGLVDFQEFCQLFKNRTGDTNLHTPGGAHWLREETESILKPPAKSPAAISVSSPPITASRRRKSKGPDMLSEDSEEVLSMNTSQPHSPGQLNDTFGRGKGTVASARETSGPITGNSHNAPLAPRANRASKTLNTTAGRGYVPYRANNSVVTCKRGWRFSQLRKNVPGSEGYNSYAVKTMEFKDLDTIVRMRQRGAEFTVREEASMRMDQRPSSEMRLVRILRGHQGSRPGSSLDVYAGNAPGTSSRAKSPSSHTHRPNTSLGMARPDSRSSSHLSPLKHRPATSMGTSRNMGTRRTLSHERGGRSEAMQKLFDEDPELGIMKLGDLGGGGGMGGESQAGSPKKLSKAEMAAEKPWQHNMKRPDPHGLTTEELLIKAALIGLYSTSVQVKDMGRDLGAGVSFFDG